MAGEIKLNSVNFASESGGTITINNGTIGSAVAMSANHPAVKTALNASGSAPVYACRAWVNFNGTGTVAIRDSGNVSSITDIGPGNYRVNLTTAMPDTNYAAMASGYDDGVNPSVTKTTSPVTTSQVILICSNVSNTLVDANPITFCVFR